MDSLIDSKYIEQLLKIVSNLQKAVIVPHVNPDGDAVGACLSFQRILKNMGKQAEVVIPNDFPKFLHWIDGSQNVIDGRLSKAKAQACFNQSDTLFVIDFNDFTRCEGFEELLQNFSGIKVMIDHHPEPASVCDLVISYPAVGSACELLFRACERAGWLNFIDTPAAEAIFTGMMTDTGNFSYNASDPETYCIIAKLLEMGIDKNRIHSDVFHTFSCDRWRLIGHALKEKMVVLPEYRTGYILLTKVELDKFNFQPGDTEGLVNYPLNVKGIVFSALFMEKDDIVKLSLRSKGKFSVNKFSRAHFNGGGHRNAAGGKTNLKIDEAAKKLVSLLPQYKNDLKNSF